MARQTFNYDQFTMTAPPAVHFAFNPWIFDLVFDPSTNIDGVLVESPSYVEMCGDRREFVNDAVNFDIRRWVQMQFDGIIEERLKAIDYTKTIAGEGLALTVNPTVMATFPEGVDVYLDFGMEFWAVWGTIGRGETFGGDETLKWFYNYPFTFDYMNLETANPSVGYGIIAEKLKPGAHLISPTKSYASGDEIVYNLQYQARLLNGDMSTQTRLVTLVPDCTPLDAKDRVYLRWVDNLGRIRYYLFTETSQTEAVSSSSWNKAEPGEPETYDSFVNDSQTALQSFTAVRTRALGAPALSADEFETLVTVCRSPIIDVFDGYDDDGNALWHRVNVAAGSYKRDRTRLQDLEFSITDRTQSTQEL